MNQPSPSPTSQPSTQPFHFMLVGARSDFQRAARLASLADGGQERILANISLALGCGADADQARAVATDGKVLGILLLKQSQLPPPSTEKPDPILVPADDWKMACNLAAKAFPAKAREAAIPCIYTPSARTLAIGAVTCRLVSGTYPPWQNCLPSRASHRWAVGAGVLSLAHLAKAHAFLGIEYAAPLVAVPAEPTVDIPAEAILTYSQRNGSWFLDPTGTAAVMVMPITTPDRQKPRHPEFGNLLP